MNHHRIVSARSTRSQRRQSPLERIDDFRERNSHSSNAELIRVMRQEYFASVDALEKSGRIKIPR